MLTRLGRHASSNVRACLAALPSSASTSKRPWTHDEQRRRNNGMTRMTRPDPREYCTNTVARASQEKEPDREDGKDTVAAGETGDKDLRVHQTEHAVISTFDCSVSELAKFVAYGGTDARGEDFINDLIELELLDKVKTVKITLYGSLAATGTHHTPQAILLGLEGSDPETIDTGTIPPRYANIISQKTLLLGGKHRIVYEPERDMVWRWDEVLKTHPNGMRFAVFGEEGELLATNEYLGGFVVNEKTKGRDKSAVHGARLHQTHSLSEPNEEAPEQERDPSQPPYPFHSGESLLALTHKHNMTIAQIVYDNEMHFGYTHGEVHEKITRIWSVMDDCIRTGVSSSETTLPGRLQLRRRAPILYRRLMRGFYPGLVSPTSRHPQIGAGAGPAGHLSGPEDEEAAPPQAEGSKLGKGKGAVGKAARPARVVGALDHAILPMPPRKTTIPAMDFLSCYAIAVNEVNASGGRIVTSPTNGAAGVIPAVLKYIIEFVSDDPEKSVVTFLLTASAIGMLFKRGSTISAAEGGCQAEWELTYMIVVACSMASAGFAAVWVVTDPETVLQHNLGLTCDPSTDWFKSPAYLGAVKAVTAAQLSMASQNVYSVTLDEAIEAMRLTAADMSVKYKETSLSRTVKIPLTVPAC
ncbi:serine dehydratase alpha chain-domain-containing protein [Fomitopsis serialis]|uniref:serine dehydratase alpha chain-domain-containing protein n=1 Tax=Fomitopsis serialis TaxID=139415 RepID=UPI0020079D4F|nr:serine dehydratase alpha chain-domain-containing protein [Neoantrodia serialis]KAH9933355.1 serine dehydratase alpha chain-domain-containing protein [Neoantrodia serialis]